MNDMEQKRAFVSDLYPGPGWKQKVHEMPDEQVIAIYLREQGKPPKKNKESEGDGEIPF